MKKRLSRVKAERKVTTSDVFRISSCVNDLEQKVCFRLPLPWKGRSIQIFSVICSSNKWSILLQLEELYEPTIKEEDSIYLVMEGGAYYDVEYKEDGWIRMNVERGDLIVIPKGLCHRFTSTPHVIFSFLFSFYTIYFHFIRFIWSLILM